MGRPWACGRFMPHTHTPVGVGGRKQGTPNPLQACPDKATAALCWSFEAQLGLEKRVGWGQHRKGQDLESQLFQNLSSNTMAL